MDVMDGASTLAVSTCLRIYIRFFLGFLRVWKICRELVFLILIDLYDIDFFLQFFFFKLVFIKPVDGLRLLRAYVVDISGCTYYGYAIGLVPVNRAYRADGVW